uniref:Uncharacterized protein n=1 Tax=Odontella aurita TaxID=265563 RepID=A0A6U6CZZ8_9STRA
MLLAGEASVDLTLGSISLGALHDCPCSCLRCRPYPKLRRFHIAYKTETIENRDGECVGFVRVKLEIFKRRNITVIFVDEKRSLIKVHYAQRTIMVSKKSR